MLTNKTKKHHQIRIFLAAQIFFSPVSLSAATWLEQQSPTLGQSSDEEQKEYGYRISAASPLKTLNYMLQNRKFNTYVLQELFKTGQLAPSAVAEYHPRLADRKINIVNAITLKTACDSTLLLLDINAGIMPDKIFINNALKVCIANGCPCDNEGHFEWTPLHDVMRAYGNYAPLSDDHSEHNKKHLIESVALFTYFGANPNKKDKDNQTPMDKVPKKYQEEIKPFLNLETVTIMFPLFSELQQERAQNITKLEKQNQRKECIIQ